LNLGHGLPLALDQFGAFSARAPLGASREPAARPGSANRCAVLVGAAGRVAYPQADRLLVAADAGGPNGYRDRLWKTELARLAAETAFAD
jgi:hypothetical protein